MEKTMEKSKNTVQAMPACDIMEENGSVQLLMDLPGVTAEHLNIDVKARQLRISGTMQDLWQGNQVEFRRNFNLSEEIDTARISAKLKNGVLTLTLPKVPSAQVHKITITQD